MINKLIIDFTRFYGLSFSRRHEFVMTNDEGGMSCSVTEIVSAAVFQRPIYCIIIGDNEVKRDRMLRRFKNEIPWREFKDLVNVYFIKNFK